MDAEESGRNVETGTCEHTCCVYVCAHTCGRAVVVVVKMLRVSWWQGFDVPDPEVVAMCTCLNSGQQSGAFETI